jgi:polysaccharide export outer membrane protein
MRLCFRVLFATTLVAAMFLLLFGGLSSRAFGQETATPNVSPKELVEYIREAKKTGQNEFQIQQNAVKSGWPEGVVNEAIAYVRSSDKDASAAALAKPRDHEKAASSKPATAPANQGAESAGTTPPVTPTGSAAPVASGVPPSGKGAAVEADGNHAAVARGVPDDYKIGAGDVLEVNVWKEPDASVHSQVVRPDGKITMPMIKEIDVVGLTPVQLEKLITEGLTKVMNLPPDVAVIVVGSNSKKIYVNGKVKKEGPIAYTYRMTVMQALSEAGGITDYAKKNKIYVLRNDNGREFRFLFDYGAVLKGQKMELNIPLEPGDVIVVP